MRPFLFAAALLSAAAPFAAAGDRPNVLFVAVDDLRPALGAYGVRAITPHIDALAADGTVFTNAHCQWPVCGASRASLMTSLYPERVGVTDLKTSMRAKDADVLTLPAHLRAHGYATAGCGKIYDPRCVDDRREMDPRSWSVPFVKLKNRNVKHGGDRFAEAPDAPAGEFADGVIGEQGLSLLDDLAGGDEPFFLAVGFKKPHLPLVAPKEYWDLYDRDALDLAEHTTGIEQDSGYVLHDSPEFRGYDGVSEDGPIPEEVRREAIHGYLACASFVDAQVGRLLDDLKERGLAENTVVVLWGDHGFHLGDHGMWGKHSTLEAATRVPLIVRPVGGSAVRATATPAELQDLFPTLCELTGVPVPEGLSGRSLVPVVSGEEEDVRTGAVTVFKNSGAFGYSFRTRRYRLTEWVNKRGKVVGTDLFDYQADPLETTNLADDPAHAAARAELSEALRREWTGGGRLAEAIAAGR